MGSTEGGSAGVKAWTPSRTTVWGILADGTANLVSGATVSPEFTLVDSGVADNINIETMLPTGSAGAYHGLAFRYSGTVGFRVTKNAADGKYCLIYNGSVIATTTIAPANNDVIRVNLNGSTITVYINGVQAAQVTNTNNQTATFHGLSSYNYGFKFDYFRIY